MVDTKVDIALTLDDDGVYDVSIGDDGDFVPTYGFDTSLIMDFFCERRADKGEVFKDAQSRGWIGNETPGIPGFEVGSKIWQMYQARQTVDTKNAVVDAAREAFAWLVPKYLDNIVITGKLSIDGIELEIEAFYKSGRTDKVLFRLWELTGV